MPPPLTQAPSGRRPALRGVLMQDISQGKGRNRSWPRKRGKAKTPEELQRQQKFAACQLAARYISPQQMCDIINGRQGTPILPRDCVTSMLCNRLAAFILPDGKVWYPMPAYENVSECLDTISQTENDILVRGSNGWVAIPLQVPSTISGPALYTLAGTYSNVTGDNTFWQVQWDTEVSGQSFLTLNTSTGAMTINESGVYSFMFNLLGTGGGTQDGFRCRWDVNGTALWQNQLFTLNQTFWPVFTNVILRLTAGDVVTSHVAIFGATKTIDFAAAGIETGFRVTRLGD